MRLCYIVNKFSTNSPEIQLSIVWVSSLTEDSEDVTSPNHEFRRYDKP